MKDQVKTKKQLLDELAGLRQRISELEATQPRPKQTAAGQDGVPVNSSASDVHRLDVELQQGHAEPEQAQEIPQEPYAWLKEAAQTSRVGFWDWNLETNQAYLSPEWKQQLGYEADEIGDHYEEWESRLHPADRDRMKATLAAYFERPWPNYEVEFRLRHKDGSYRWILTSAGLITDDTGKPLRMVGSHVDVTEIRRVQEALGGESESLLQLIADALPVFISYVDRDERYRFNNSFYQRTFGLSPQEIRGRRVREFLGAKAHTVIRPYLKKAISGERVDFEADVPFPDGTMRKLESTFIPHIDNNGQCQGFYVLARDVTERVEVEERLRRHQEELAHVSRVATMGELATTLAHELNQPLTAILTNAQALQRLLASQKVSRNELQDALADIVNDAARAGEVVRREREFMRKRDLEKEPLNINEVVRHIGTLLNTLALLDGITLTLDLAHDLPQTVGDRIQIEQVLLNLVRNGSEAMKGVDTTQELLVQTSLHGTNEILVVVADRGPRIEDEVFLQMFDPFYTTKPGGFGVGLSISRAIIEAHGGQLWAEQNEGQGIKMCMNLPCRQEIE